MNTHALKYILIFSVLIGGASRVFSAHGGEESSAKRPANPYDMAQEIRANINIHRANADKHMRLTLSVPNREFPLSFSDLKRHLLTALQDYKDIALDIQQDGGENV